MSVAKNATGDAGEPVVPEEINVLTLDGIEKGFGDFRAVNGLSLTIHKGELFSLLGPSGCGKSTTLRIVAGLEHPERGEMRLNDATLFSSARRISVPTQKRKMGMVFQSYAIWPHLTVFETVAYPLVIRKLPKERIREKVMFLLKQVGLEEFADRPGPNLSGGQQQRVALARALIYDPELLLLDEPFSNLDVQLREQMRVELKQLQRRLGITVILVTHDQMEALSLSDRIALMRSGRIEQLGSPVELYEKPLTPFVRDFIGTSLRLDGVLVDRDSQAGRIKLTDGQELSGVISDSRLQIGQPAALFIRPERIHVVNEAGPNIVSAVIETLLFVGDRYDCVLRIANTRVNTFLFRPRHVPAFQEGVRIFLELPSDDVSLWLAER